MRRSLLSTHFPIAVDGGRRSVFHRFLCISALTLCVAATVLSHDQVFAQPRSTQPDAPTVTVTPEPERPEAEVPAYLDRVVDSDKYYVGPGDRIGISIIGTTPTSFELTVNPEATLLIPAIGVVDLRGLKLSEAKSRLVHFLHDYYPNASLTVSLLEVRRFRVAIVGAVLKPGLKVVTANTRASEVLSDAELGDLAARRSIRLFREADTLGIDLVAFERLGNQEANPYLIEGDIIAVPVVDYRWGWVTISGAVRAPGRLELVAGERIADLIELAHGLTANVDTLRLELWRFQAGDSVSACLEWPAGSSYTDWCQTELQPDDQIIIREVEGYRRRSSVTISGAVVRPGVYVFPKRHVSLRALVDSAGGFTPEADLEHAYAVKTSSPAWLEEQEQRITQIPTELRSDLESDWIQASALSTHGRISTDFVSLFDERDLQYDIMLTDADSVVVPERTEYVNVLGRVVRPGFVAFQPGQELSYYLDRVGGYTWRADRGRTFVIKGGTGAALKKGRVRSLDPGDIIIVPTKREKGFWTSLKESLIVAANLATIYLVIDQATQ